MTRRSALKLIGAASAAAQETIFDLLIKHGEVFDPASRRRGRFDIGITGPRIAKIAPSLPASRSRLTIDAGEYLVTPGLIDLRVHCDTLLSGGVHAGHHATRSGVTTVVDSGSATASNLDESYSRMRVAAHTRILCWLRSDQDASVDSVAATAAKHRDIIAGIWAPKAEDLPRARTLAAAIGKPLLTGAPSAASLKQGEIQTQVFAPDASAVDDKRKLRPELASARGRGVLFDSGDLWFRIAGPAIGQGFLPDTVSTNLTVGSARLPEASMMTTLSKLVNLGVTVNDALERVTAGPARALRRPDLGTLREGGPADLALIAVESERRGFLDAGHTRLSGGKSLRAALTLRQGKVVWDLDGLVSADWLHTGPYSNFR
ncbi:MAG: amidohydrolase family protein [Acidobacteria bacterium]|nr:amidohydrolase family protein [Acidobacteriota bacterium]